MSTTEMRMVAALRTEQHMSAQMQLAIRVLGMSREELDAELREAAERNPMLRLADGATGAEVRGRIRRLERAAGVRAPREEDGRPWEETVARGETLREHVLRQVGTTNLFGAELRFAELVLGNLDERGWLDLEGGADAEGRPLPALTLDDLAREAGLDPEDAEEVLSIVQRLDPPGVAARSLVECLKVQAEAKGLGALELDLIERHLPRLERRRYDVVARELGVDVEDVRDAAREVAALEPWPARPFGAAAAVATRRPEVAIRKVDGEYVVVDLQAGAGACSLSDAALARYAADRRALRFLKKCRRDAEWLLTAVELRSRLVLLVAREIARHQREFLDRGPRFLRPLTMQRVADAVGVHESSVSRAVAGKSVDTPQGVHDLRSFFRNGVAVEGSAEVSSDAVRDAVRALVAGEDPRRPLSDDAIARELLAREGVRVARRTVAKYRAQLGILASQCRARDP